MTKKENNSRSKVSKYTKNIEKDLVKTDKELSAALDGKRMFEKLNESQYANRYSEEVSRLKDKSKILIAALATNEVRDEMQSDISGKFGSTGGAIKKYTEKSKSVFKRLYQEAKDKHPSAYKKSLIRNISIPQYTNKTGDSILMGKTEIYKLMKEVDKDI
jgi:hypothetical protein